MSENGEREPWPGELCECGRPAVVVFETEKFGSVPWCGRPDDRGGVADQRPGTGRADTPIEET